VSKYTGWGAPSGIRERELKARKPPIDLGHGKPCPTCGGEVVVSSGSAWCVHPYAKGGCGSHWKQSRRGDWTLTRL
jgi:hypothetical protein